jgi:hypothetical protein
MTNFRWRLSFSLAVSAVCVACPGDLISDPSFDLWCGQALCSPWEATGRVSRVTTCDDGASEYRQDIPESHWAKLRFFVKTPSWYDSVRFILRKNGTGKAVLAQIKASAWGECAGDPVVLAGRPLGAPCEAADQCESALCGAASFDLHEGWTHQKCGECSNDDPCADGAACGFGLSEVGTYAHCTPAGESQFGASCVTGAECASGVCAPPTHEPCASCRGDDCTEDPVWIDCEARSFAGTCL